MSARQLIILAVAFVAAIAALLLIRGMNSRDRQEDAPAPIAGQQVLVVARDVPQGAALTGSDIAWRLFPDASVGDQFITQSRRPEALTELQNAVTRRPFAAGEPVTMGSVVLPEGRGFMAAMLTPGYRAVSIEVDTATIAGGFIQPNDYVDVILTQKMNTDGGGDQIRATIILANVRVLALDEKVQTQTSGGEPERTEPSVAVLELSQADARRLAQADRQGEITLALRGVQMETGPAPSAVPASGGDGGAGVTIHAFGRVIGGSR